MKLMIILCVIIILLILCFIYPPFIKTSSYQGKISDHFDGNVFYNTTDKTPKKSFPVLKWWFLRNRPAWPKQVKNVAVMPITPALQDEIKVTFVNHATLLIQTNKNNILTDPIWSKRASPVSWFGPKRVSDLIITFLPTQHWSARWLTDKFKTLWGSYGIQIKKIKLYFTGDTGYSSYFKLIQQKWGSPDLAFIPIGAYLPRWIMEKNHLNPNEAVKAHLDLQSTKSFAIHYGTFQLSDEYYEQPVDDLQKALKAHVLTEEQFGVLAEGHTYKMLSLQD